MMASAWKIVGNILRELIDRGMSNKNIKALLKNDNRIRGLYFALFRMVEVMVDINQQRFSGLALNSGTRGEGDDQFALLKDCSALCEILQATATKRRSDR